VPEIFVLAPNVRKFKYEEMSEEERLLLAKCLTSFGSTLDEYRASASTGTIDTAFPEVCAPIATGQLPHGLQVIESGAFLSTATHDFLGDKDGDDNGGDKENSDAVVMSPGKGSPSSSRKGTLQPRTATTGPPPATRILGGSYGIAGDDFDEEESGDELHRNKRNYGGNKANSAAVVMSPGKGSPSFSGKGTLESGDELHRNKRNCGDLTALSAIQKDAPYNPWLSGIFCLYVQEKSPTTGQSDGNNHRLK